MTPLSLMIALAVVAAILGCIDFYRNHTAAPPIPIDWRGILARLPLPMLALAASYGVYSFALLFVPEWVAITQAAAFELTYVGLAVTQGLGEQQRKRATGISIGAVAASIIYNTLAGWFHAQPQLLVNATAISWLCLAILHGAPLAWVAYLVADLLLHSGAQTTLQGQTQVDEIEEALGAPVLVQIAQANQRISGFVYVLQSQSDGHKIGCATDVEKRLRQIASFVPFDVAVVHTIFSRDMYATEARMHRYFDLAGKRINGEWFALTSVDVSAIRAIETSDIDAVFERALGLLAKEGLRDKEFDGAFWLQQASAKKPKEYPTESLAPVLEVAQEDQAIRYECPWCHNELASKQAKGSAARYGCENVACPGRSNRKEVRKAA